MAKRPEEQSNPDMAETHDSKKYKRRRKFNGGENKTGHGTDNFFAGNEAVYDIAKSELPDKIEDLFNEKTGKTSSIVRNQHYREIFLDLVRKWKLDNKDKDLGKIEKEELSELKRKAREDFVERFPDEAKKYKGFESPADRMKEDQEILDKAWMEKANGIKSVSAIRTMEEVEKERARKAQEEINKTDFGKEGDQIKPDPVKTKNSGDKQKEFFAGKKREDPEIIDVEFVEHKPLEITDQNWRGERQKSIEKLQKELEQARKEYLEMDYKKRGMWQRVGRFFGDKIFGRKGKEEVAMKVGEKTGEMIVDDQDVVYMRALYENKLMDLRNAMLEDAKAGGMKAESLAEAEKLFEVESRVKLADEHDNVRVENSGRFAGPLREKLVKMNEWYKKQPLKYKLAVGAAFGLGGAAVGAGVITGFGAVAVTSAAFAKRFAMGMISGTSAAIATEKVAEKSRAKRAEKGSAEFAKEIENLGEEELYNKFKEKTQELIFSADDKLQSYKNWDRIRLALGGAVAGIISSGAAGEIFKFLSGKSGMTELAPKVWHKVAGIFKYGTPETASGTGVSIDSNMPAGGENATVKSGKVKPVVFGNNETIENAGTLAPDSNATVEKSGAKISGKTIPEAKAEISKNINLEVKKGGSFEGAIIKQLEGSGVNKKEAGKVAHRMYLEYVRNHPDPTGKGYNLVHPGAKIELSPDGKHIVSFRDSLPSEWDKHPGGHARSGRVPHVPKSEMIPEKSVTEPFDFNKTSQDLSGMKAMERELTNIAAREGNFRGFSYGQSKVNLAYLDDQINQYNNRIKFYGNPDVLDGKERDTARSLKETLEDLTRRKAIVELKIRDFERFKELNEMFSGSVSKVFNKIAKLALFEAGAHEEFSLEKMAASQYIEKHPGGNFGKFYKDCVKIYGKKMINPFEGENMQDWTGRITKLIVRNRMMSEN